jgi:hypothetical protein
MAPLTTLNIVVTPQMPSASTTMARKENARSLRSTRKPMRTSWPIVGSIKTLDEGRQRTVPRGFDPGSVSD